MNNWEHQEEAIKRFKDKEYFGLLFDCGTGKTRTAIKIAEEKGLPVLVITPKAVMKEWVSALESHCAKEYDCFVYSAEKKGTKKYKDEFKRFINGA